MKSQFKSLGILFLSIVPAVIYAQTMTTNQSGLMAQLKAYHPSAKAESFLLTGYHAVADGGEGMFMWAETSSMKEDGATVVKPDNYSGNGKWMRLSDNSLVNGKWYGAYGDGEHDDSKALQDAIDNAHDKELYLPAGVYKITKTLLYVTSGYSNGIHFKGAGESTVIDFAFADKTPLILIDGASAKPYQFQRGGYIKDILITSKKSFAANSQGDALNITGWWLGEVSNVVIRQCYGNGIVSPLKLDVDKNPDAYATAQLNITACEITFIDGAGIVQESGLGSANWRIIHNRIGGCKGGGIVIGGHHTLVENNGIFSNGLDNELKPGLTIQRVQTNPMGTRILDNEFDNNALCHILLNGSANTVIEQNRMNSWETIFKKAKKQLYPSVHVLFNTSIKGAQNINVELKYNYHRSQHAKTGGSGDFDLTLYDFQTDTNNADIEVINPFIPANDNTPKIKVTNDEKDSNKNKARKIRMTLKSEVQ